MNRCVNGAQLAKLVRRLVDDGVVDCDAARDGRLMITDLSRSNPVGLVSVDGCPRVVMKGGTMLDDGIDPVQSELAAYRWLGASPETAGLAPTPFREVAGGTTIVIPWLGNAVSLHEAVSRGTPASELLIAEIGRLLGTLHRARPVRTGLPARRPWILDVPAGRVPVIAVGNERASRMIESIAQSVPIAAAITRLARTWTYQTMIHGDVKFDNILVTDDGMLLVDWELAGLGAPVWDLAGVVDGLLLPSCVNGCAESLDVALVAQLAEPALAAHRTVAGANLSPTPEELAAAVVARLAQTATQLAAMSLESEDAAESASLVFAGALTLAGTLASDPRPAAECVS